MSLLEPFAYNYMFNAIWVSAVIGGVCAFFSCYMMLKGWSLIGDAMSHAAVPGVAGAYIMAVPFSIGAFLACGLAAAAMFFLHPRSKLKASVIIGVVFSSWLAMGLFMGSLSPMSVNIQDIILGNVLAISPYDIGQTVIISCLSLLFLVVKWKDLMIVFFDEVHARSAGIRLELIKSIFFVSMAASLIAALQVVGAALVVSMVVAPGATAYLLTDRFPRLLAIAVVIGALTGFIGAYASCFLNGATGGVIVVLQTLLFLLAFVVGPKHGLLARRRRGGKALAVGL